MMPLYFDDSHLQIPYWSLVQKMQCQMVSRNLRVVRDETEFMPNVFVFTLFWEFFTVDAKRLARRVSSFLILLLMMIRLWVFFIFLQKLFLYTYIIIYDEQEFNTNRNENSLKCGYIYIYIHNVLLFWVMHICSF